MNVALIVFVSVQMALLSGCSTVDENVDRFGRAMTSVGDGLQSVTGNVETVKVDEQHFQLTEFYYEPVTTFDSWSLRAKAREVCPDGYVYQIRQALRAGEFAKSHEVCESEQACGYALQWKIQCKKVPYEPFSIFGKS